MKAFETLPQCALGSLIRFESRPKINAVGLRIIARELRCGGLGLRSELLHNLLSNAFLNGEDIAGGSIESFRPQVCARCGVDNLYDYSQPFAREANAAGEDGIHLELFADAGEVLLLSANARGRVPGDYAQIGNPREVVGQFPSETLAEISGVFAYREILKRQHCDATATARRRSGNARPFAQTEFRKVSALRQFNDDFIQAAFILEIFAELGSQPPGFDANDWIEGGFE